MKHFTACHSQGRLRKISLREKSGKSGRNTWTYYFMPKHLNLVDKPSNVSLTSTYAL